MFETFLTVWIAGSACMTLDFLRLYRKAIRKSREMKKLVLSTITNVLTKDPIIVTSNDQLSKFVETLEQDFENQISYFRFLLVGIFTMSMFWPIALFNLLFGEQLYEKAMLDSFSKPFRIVFANLYLQVQEYLASQLTAELFNDLFESSLQEMTDRKDK